MKKHVFVHDDVYKTGYYVCYKTTVKEYSAIIKKVTGVVHVPGAGDGNEGRVTGNCYECYYGGKILIFIWALSLPCLLHELFHAVSWTLRARFSLNDKTDEPYAYFFESLFRRTWRAIHEK